MGCIEAEVIFLGCLKISWTDPLVCVCAECPPWDFYTRGSIECRQSFYNNCSNSKILQNVAKYHSILILFRIAKRSIFPYDGSVCFHRAEANGGTGGRSTPRRPFVEKNLLICRIFCDLNNWSRRILRRINA